MNIHDKFRFTLTMPDTSTRQVYPVVNDLVFSWKKVRNELFYRTQLETALVFGNNPKLSIDDFDFLKTEEDAGNLCDNIVVDIDIYCDGAWNDFYTGYLELISASWDFDQCILEVKTVTTDAYTCLENNWDEEINFFQINPTRHEVEGDFNMTFTFGSYSDQILDYDPLVSGFVYPVPPITPGGTPGYPVLVDYSTNGVGFDFKVDFDYTWHTRTISVECVGGVPYVPPIGSDFNLIADDCAGSGLSTYEIKGPVRTTFNNLAGPLNGLEFDTPPTWPSKYELYQLNTRMERELLFIGKTFPNGISLEDFLVNYLSLKCGLDVVSDFFNINPDATAPANTPYTYSVNVHNLFVFQKSDVKRPEASEEAFVLNFKFKEFLDALKAMFNLQWLIDGTTFRIEHVSYFALQNGIDLTGTGHSSQLLGRNSYEYESGGFAIKEEIFEWMEAEKEDFIGKSILYDCGGSGEISNILSNVTTDIEYIYRVGNDPDTSDEISDEGIAIMATYEINGNYYLNIEPGVLSGDAQYNNHLSWANLHDRYHRHNRQFLTGNMNGEDEAFDSAIKKKAQEEIQTTLCCGDILTFNPSDLIKSQIGWAEIKEAKWSGESNKFTVQLLHD